MVRKPPVDEARVERVEPPEPKRSEPSVMLERPVPPRATASVPIHVGVKVCVSADEVMVRPKLVSEDVAKV